MRDSWYVDYFGLSGCNQFEMHIKLYVDKNLFFSFLGVK